MATTSDSSVSFEEYDPDELESRVDVGLSEWHEFIREVVRFDQSSLQANAEAACAPPSKQSGQRLSVGNPRSAPPSVR